MIQLRLPTETYHIDLVANDMAAIVTFQVLGPNTEVAFVEELFRDSFCCSCLKVASGLLGALVAGLLRACFWLLSRDCLGVVVVVVSC